MILFYKFAKTIIILIHKILVCKQDFKKSRCSFVFKLISIATAEYS